MQSLHEFVRSLGGLAQTRELLAVGVTSHQLTEVVRRGGLFRARQGWYALPDAREDFVRAVRVGGRLAGASAAASYGLATPHEYPLHVQVPRRASRLRSQHDRFVRLSGSVGEATVIHRGVVQPPTPETRFRVSLRDCLVQVIIGEIEDDAVACLDSALRKNLVDAIDLELLRQCLPRRLRYIADVADGRSDSYPESVARRRLARAGILAVPQVPVLGERWIDLLIGDRLAIEVDGAGKYGIDKTPGEVARRVHADRQRDAFLEALGYHVIRLSYRMVVFDWPATLSMILAVIERGDHLSRPKFMHR